MLGKIAALFLICMAVLALFGRLRISGIRPGSARCPDCGRYRIGKGSCPCGKA